MLSVWLRALNFKLRLMGISDTHYYVTLKRAVESPGSRRNRVFLDGFKLADLLNLHDEIVPVPLDFYVMLKSLLIGEDVGSACFSSALRCASAAASDC